MTPVRDLAEHFQERMANVKIQLQMFLVAETAYFDIANALKDHPDIRVRKVPKVQRWKITAKAHDIFL